MIWNSVFLTTLIDILIIFAVLYSIAIFYKHYRAAMQLGLTLSVNFILSGLALIGLFYLFDLSILHIYPLFTPQTFAMASMTSLHLNWSWIGILMSVGAIAIGLSYLVQALIPKTFQTLQTLELTKNNLNEEIATRQRVEAAMRETLDNLERQVKGHTIELESINTKLQQVEELPLGIEVFSPEHKQVEEALRKSEERYRAIVEDQTELICRMWPDETFNFVNEAYCRYYGKQREELIGSRLEPSPILDDDREILRKHYDSLGLEKPLGTIEHRVRLPNGEVRWQQWSNRALLDEAGRVIEYQSVGRDITERKQAEEALTRRVREMEALYDTSLEINARLEISILLQAIVRRATELLGTQMGGLFLMQPDGETLELVVGHNQPDENIGRTLRLEEGLSGRVAQLGEPLQISNYRSWKGQVGYLGYASIGRILGVPLKREDQVIGVLNVFDEEEGDFDQDGVQLLSLFAVQAVIAIENARLIEHAHHGRERLKMLHEIDQAILTAQSSEEIAEAALGYIRRLIPWKQASVLLYDFEANESTLLAIHLEGDTRLTKGQRFVLEPSENITRLRQGQPYSVEDVAALAKPSDTEQQLLAEGIRSYISLPLIFRDELIGSFNLGAADPGTFDQEPIEIACQIAGQLAIAIQQAQLREAETQRRREAETLRDATVALTSELKLDQVLEVILIYLETVVPYDSAGVFLQEGDHLRAVAGRGFPVSENVVGRTYPLENDVLFPDIQHLGRPLILADAQADPRFVRWAGTNYIRGWIGVPLIVSGQVIGFLTLDNRQVAAYSEAEAALAQAFANQAAIAIENARLFDQVQHYTKELEQRVADRTRELSALYDVTAVASESLDLQTALERSLEQVLDAMRTGIGIIRLLDEAGEMLYLVAQHGIPPGYVERIEVVSSGSGLAGQVIEHGKPLIVPDVTIDPRAAQTSFLAPQTAYVGVPIRARGRVLGTLSIFKENGQPQFSMEEVTLLTSIADHVGVVVESARLRQLARQAAVLEERGRLARDLHDSVTQLLYSLNLFAEVGQESHRAGDMDEVDNSLREIREITQQALKEMRLLVYELRPATLEQEGLIGALQHRLDAVEGRTGVKARLLLGEMVELDDHLEEALYHITQEALNNALKHAAATVVTVRLNVDEEQQVTLEIADNGSGFDQDTLNGGGLGLVSMRERAEGLGGTITIKSTPGEGTTVEVRVKIGETNNESSRIFLSSHNS